MSDRNIDALTPLDGRYKARLAELRHAGFKEREFIIHKLRVEVEWVIFLLRQEEGPFCDRGLIDDMHAKLQETLRYEWIVKEVIRLEAIINHDTKACEYAIRGQFEHHHKDHLKEFVHLGLTSEDVSGLAHAHTFVDGWAQVVVPETKKILEGLRNLALKEADAPLMSMTHGQPATPTTFGKEIANFFFRLERQNTWQDLPNGSVPVKFGGAVGNFNAVVTAYPGRDWIDLCTKFVTARSSKFTLDLHTTQIGNKEWLVERLHQVTRFNNILLDCCKDMWLYCSRGLLKLEVVGNEVGSSTMPHKVNPIDFENAEGNLELANGLMQTICQKLSVSRLQRDLSDSTVMRNIGTALGYSVLAWTSFQKGMEKISFDRYAALAELDKHWELLAEPVQTVMRKYPAIEDPYNKLKALTRGQELGKEDYLCFIRDNCSNVMSHHDMLRLEELTPATYTGLAESLAREVESQGDYNRSEGR